MSKMQKNHVKKQLFDAELNLWQHSLETFSYR